MCFNGHLLLILRRRLSPRDRCVLDHLLFRSSQSKMVVVGVSSSGFGIGVMSIVLGADSYD